MSKLGSSFALPMGILENLWKPDGAAEPCCEKVVQNNPFEVEYQKSSKDPNHNVESKSFLPGILCIMMAMRNLPLYS